MTTQQRDVILMDLVDEELATYREKGLAYAGTGDTLANFKRNAERLDLTKYQVWGVYFNKHIDSINNAIAQNPGSPVDKTEGLRGRIVDARNYLGILLCLLTEDKEDFKCNGTGRKPTK